jgi:hypothetical protein
MMAAGMEGLHGKVVGAGNGMGTDDGIGSREKMGTGPTILGIRGGPVISMVFTGRRGN